MTLNVSAQTSVTHTIQRGETIESVANKYGISVTDLQQANPDTKEYLYVGMKLTIPAASAGNNTTVVQQQNVPSQAVNQQNAPQQQYVGNMPNTNATKSRKTYDSSNESVAGKADIAMELTASYLFLDDDISDAYTYFNLGMNASFGATYNIDEMFSATAMVGYSAKIKSCKSAYKKIFGNWEYHFITLPVRFRANIAENFTLYAGPRFDFMVAAKQELGKESYNLSQIKKMSKSLGKNFKTTYTYIDLGIKINKFTVSYSLPLDGDNKIVAGMINVGAFL